MLGDLVALPRKDEGSGVSLLASFSMHRHSDVLSVKYSISRYFQTFSKNVLGGFL